MFRQRRTSEIRRNLRKQFEQKEVSPGLYLPDPVTVEKIIAHCQARVQEIRDWFRGMEKEILDMIADIRADREAYTGSDKEMAELRNKWTKLLTDSQRKIMQIYKLNKDTYSELDIEIRIDSLNFFNEVEHNILGHFQKTISYSKEPSRSYEYLRVKAKSNKSPFIPLPDELLVFEGFDE